MVEDFPTFHCRGNRASGWMPTLQTPAAGVWTFRGSPWWKTRGAGAAEPETPPEAPLHGASPPTTPRKAQSGPIAKQSPIRANAGGARKTGRCPPAKPNARLLFPPEPPNLYCGERLTPSPTPPAEKMTALVKAATVEYYLSRDARMPFWCAPKFREREIGRPSNFHTWDPVLAELRYSPTRDLEALWEANPGLKSRARSLAEDGAWLEKCEGSEGLYW